MHNLASQVCRMARHADPSNELRLACGWDHTFRNVKHTVAGQVAQH